MPKWCPSRVLQKKVWTEGLFTLTIDASEVEPFKPGQFLHLANYPGGKPDSPEELDGSRVNRPYSVASPHGDTIEFFVVLVEDGELTPNLWSLEPGDEIEVSQKAAGRFTLEKTPDAKNIWLVATGTGLAPYIAMLRDKTIWERFEKVVVVHGARHANDLAYTEELKELEKAKDPGRFRLIQSLTREEAPDTLKGRIPGLVESGEIEEAAGCQITADDSSVLLCGNPAMLDSMEALLGQRNMQKHRTKSPGQIVLERYW